VSATQAQLTPRGWETRERETGMRMIPEDHGSGTMR
jgi:hypothetical protein